MAESRIKDDNYYQISGWMITRLKLKGENLQIYAIIYGFTQDGQSEFTGSIQYLADFTNTSRPTVIKALKELTEQGLLIKTKAIANGVTFTKYRVNFDILDTFKLGSKETLPPVKKLYSGSKETLQGGSKETLHNNNTLNNKCYKEIIYIVDYLNKVAGTSYRPNGRTTQEHIKARLNEGFTMDDFKKVIDSKVREWKGTNMEQYLRPITLFGAKFESYLNAAPKETQRNDDLDGIF